MRVFSPRNIVFALALALLAWALWTQPVLRVALPLSVLIVALVIYLLGVVVNNNWKGPLA